MNKIIELLRIEIKDVERKAFANGNERQFLIGIAMKLKETLKTLENINNCLDNIK